MGYIWVRVETSASSAPGRRRVSLRTPRLGWECGRAIVVERDESAARQAGGAGGIENRNPLRTSDMHVHMQGGRGAQ